MEMILQHDSIKTLKEGPVPKGFPRMHVPLRGENLKKFKLSVNFSIFALTR